MDENIVLQGIEIAYKNYLNAANTLELPKVRKAYDSLIQAIEVARYQGLDVSEFQAVTTDRGQSAQDLIDEMRFTLESRRRTSKIEDARCKCSKGRKGKLGKRDTASGMVEVNLRRGGNVKCLDIGIGERAEGSEVIAYIPSKSQTGFVDYKG